MKLRINAIIKSIDKKTGKILDISKVHNKVVDTGLNRVARLLGGLSSTSFGYLAIGTDNTAEQASDTSLGTEVKRSSANITNPSNGVIKFQKIFTFSSGESYTIVEAGIFDSAVESGSTMLDRLTFTGKDVDADTDLDATITITVEDKV